MNYGGDAADQIVRYSMEGMEHTLRISGSIAKNLAGRRPDRHDKLRPAVRRDRGKYRHLLYDTGRYPVCDPRENRK